MWTLIKRVCTLAIIMLSGALTLEPGVGYVRPATKLGVNDQAFTNLKGLDNHTIYARNQMLVEQMTPSLHEFNVFWNAFEVTHSTPEPEVCADGYMQVPAGPNGLLRNGGIYAAYHCYSKGTTAQLRKSLQADASVGWESAAVIWCTAVPYRDKGCLGQPEAATQSAPEDPPPGYAQFVQSTDARTSQLQIAVNTLPDGSVGTQSATDVAGCSCAPTVESYPDFQDYMTFLGNNLSTPEAHFTHYIVYNEVSSAFWWDLSPRVDVTKEVDPEGLTTWTNAIIDVLNLARNGLARVPYPIMIYVSTDRYWGAAPTLAYGTQRVHIGSKRVVDAVLHAGPLLDWNVSVAVHPYEQPTLNQLDGKPAAYNYITLKDISQYLDFQLKVVGKTGSVMMAATEQGIQASLHDDEARAKWLCEAHNLTLATPNLLFSSHNDFQKSPGASDDFSFIVSDDPLLKDAADMVTYQAYRSFSTKVWGLSREHYCCRTHNLGCA